MADTDQVPARMSDSQSEPRRLSGLLMLGILAVPVVFSWFTLRKGYSHTLRLGVFLYAAFAFAVGIVHVASP